MSQDLTFFGLPIFLTYTPCSLRTKGCGGGGRSSGLMFLLPLGRPRPRLTTGAGAVISCELSGSVDVEAMGSVDIVWEAECVGIAHTDDDSEAGSGGVMGSESDKGGRTRC